MYQAHIQEALLYRKGFLTIMLETHPPEGTFAIGGRRDSVRMEQDAPRWSLTTGGLSQQTSSQGALCGILGSICPGEKKKDLKNVS